MNNEVMFSFIVLSYNQFEKIKRMINSIMFIGDHFSYEILIMDDGSTDETTHDKFKNKKITFLKEEKNTRNQSLLRNKAVKKAKGKYIIFADGDDFFNKDKKTIKVFLEKIERMLLKEEEFDVIFYEVEHVDLVNGLTYTIMMPENLNENIKDIPHGTHGYIVNREFLLKNDIWHDEEVYIFDGEDIYFSYQIYDKMEKVFYYYGDSPVYVHIIDDESTSNDKYNDVNYKAYFNKMISDIKKIIKKEELFGILDMLLIDEELRIWRKNKL
jgi:glycosyltransferase involved in cell wall biosynthesis